MAIGFFPPSDITSTHILPTPVATGTPGYFTKGGGTVAATIVSQDFLNGIVSEFNNLATAGGTPLTVSTPTMVTNINGLITQHSSLYVAISGSVMSGNLGTGYNYSAAQSVSALQANNGTYNIGFSPRSVSGYLNPLTLVNDAVISFTTGTINTGGLVIGPWSNGTAGGIRIDNAGNLTLSERVTLNNGLYYAPGTLNRWSETVTGTESGSNSGSDYQLVSFSDAGTSLALVLTATRSTGIVAFGATPTAPTPTTSDNSTNIATTAFVNNQNYAPLASPGLTGTPTAPTPTSTDRSTKVATTAFTTGRYIHTQYFKTVGTFTYTPTTGTGYIEVEIQAGGGGGAGVNSPPTGYSSVGSSGGAGGYTKVKITSGFSGATIVVGAGGASVAASNGYPGGNSSFGSYSANGANGGTYIQVSNSASGAIIGGAGGAAASTGDLTITGEFGGGSELQNGISLNNTPGYSGRFGASYGAGGYGSSQVATGPAVAGYNGSGGIVIVSEYS